MRDRGWEVRGRVLATLLVLGSVARNAGLGVIALLLLGVVLVGIALVPVLGAGVPVLVGVLGLVEAASASQRRWAGAVLGVDVPGPSDAEPAGRGRSVWARFGRTTRRSSTWRAVLWLVWQVLAGLGAVFLLALIVFGAVQVLAAASSPVDVVVLLIPAVVLVLVVGLLAGPLNRMHAAVSRWLLAPPGYRSRLDRRVEQLTRTRSAAVDAQATTLRRIERDLHDGAQAHLVALGMSIGLARSLVQSSPEQAEALLTEAQAAVAQTLTELRTLVRGIHPPVLAERGLGGAVEAVALRCAVPVEVRVDLPGRFEAAVEAAVYFALAEVLTNVAKHSGARHAGLTLSYDDVEGGGVLRVVVVDDGGGGADPAGGSGLRGIGERLAAFDGTLKVMSPAGGPTEILMELPCVPLSPRISSCSETGSSGS